MTELPDPNARDGGGAHDWDDRAIDAALHELGGQRPPDLSARVLVALAEQPAGELPRLRQRAPRLLPRLLAAALLMLVGMVAAFASVHLANVYLAGDGQRVTATTTALGVEVFDGAIDYVRASPASPPIRLGAGDRATVVPVAGDRLRVARRARVRLGAFPTLSADRPMEMEIRSMETTMKNGVVAASSLTVGVIAGIVGWSTWNGPAAAGPGDVVRLEAEAAGPDLMAENTRLRARVRALEQQNDQLLAVSERSAAPPEPVDEPSEEPPAAVEPASAMVFDDAKYSAALDKIDWRLMGETTYAMQPLMAELVRKLEEDGEIPPELAVKIQQLNSDLLAQVPDMLEAGLPGTGPNGAYTHPIVVSNVLANTLQAAGKPLDADQQRALEGLIQSFGAELDAVEAGQFDFDSERLLREVEVKDRFYEEMASRLTPEQFAAIYPEGSTGFDGVSLFGTGLLTRQFVRTIESRDAAEFARRTSTRMGEELRLNEADTRKLRAVIERMAGSNGELWAHPGSVAESKLKFLRRGRTDAAMRNQVAMLREISRQLSLSAEQRETLGNLKGVLVPLPPPQ